MTSAASSHMEHLSKAAIRLIDHRVGYVMRYDTSLVTEAGLVGGDSDFCASAEEVQCLLPLGWVCNGLFTEFLWWEVKIREGGGYPRSLPAAVLGRVCLSGAVLVSAASIWLLSGPPPSSPSFP